MGILVERLINHPRVCRRKDILSKEVLSFIEKDVCRHLKVLPTSPTLQNLGIDTFNLTKRAFGIPTNVLLISPPGQDSFRYCLKAAYGSEEEISKKAAEFGVGPRVLQEFLNKFPQIPKRNRERAFCETWGKVETWLTAKKNKIFGIV